MKAITAINANGAIIMINNDSLIQSEVTLQVIAVILITYRVLLTNTHTHTYRQNQYDI